MSNYVWLKYCFGKKYMLINRLLYRSRIYQTLSFDSKKRAIMVYLFLALFVCFLDDDADACMRCYLVNLLN